jgi:hypothetical protein
MILIMSFAQKLTADALFALQICLSIVSGGSQFFRLLTTSQGVNVSWLASWLIFLLINLGLTIRGHYSQPSRVTLQTVLTYASWSTVIAADLGAMIWQGRGLWDLMDTVTATMVGLGVAITWWRAHWLGLKITDPVVNGFMALCFISLPQLTLTYKIFLHGGQGLAGTMLFAGHIGILTRLGQLWFSIQEAGWDRNRQGAALGEIANESTWLLVTLAWIVN